MYSEDLLLAVVAPRALDEIPRIMEVLGREWMGERLLKAEEKISMRHGFTPSAIGVIERQMAHPIITELGSFIHGQRQELLRLGLLEASLDELWPLKDVTALARRLRDGAEYEKVEYELLIASSYHRAGVAVKTNFGHAGPDIGLVSQTGEQIPVECKRKDSRTGSEERLARFRHQVDQELVNRLDAEALYYHLTLTPLDDLDSLDPGEFIEAVVGMCRKGDLLATVLFDRVRVFALRLSDDAQGVPDEVVEMLVPSKINSFRKSSMRQVDGEIDPSTHWKPVQIKWEITDDVVQKAKGVERSLREAAGQLPREGSSLVYIDLNSRYWYESKALITAGRGEIQRALKGAHRRLNHVVLTSVFPSRTRDDFEALAVHAAVVRQANPRRELPTDIPVLVETPYFHRQLVHGRWVGDRPGDP